MNKLLYFDNNSTTAICQSAKHLMESWIQKPSNASGSSSLSIASQKMIQEFKDIICKTCKISEKKYEILITSGATESNCMILRMVVDACNRLNKKPHIITSLLEHKSILECLKTLEEHDKKVDVTYISPNIYGVIDPQSVKESIQPNTVLISIMYANNELGTINPISSIAKIAHDANIPFHTDAVQVFGKVAIIIDKIGIDALTMTFHKMYGPQGIGLLIVRKDFISGYNLQGIINGTQQNGLRGGTESNILIAGAIASMLDTFIDREKKNNHLKILKKTFLLCMFKICDQIHYSAILADEKLTGGKKDFGICILGHPEDTIPNTVLLSFIPQNAKLPQFCNVKFKKLMEDKKIIVSIGSACNTISKKASHVLDAIGAPLVIKRGVLRISFSDNTTMSEIKSLVLGLQRCLLFLAREELASSGS